MLLLVTWQGFIDVPGWAEGTSSAWASEMGTTFASDTRVCLPFDLMLNTLTSHLCVDIVDGGLGSNKPLKVGFDEDL